MNVTFCTDSSVEAGGSNWTSLLLGIWLRAHPWKKNNNNTVLWHVLGTQADPQFVISYVRQNTGLPARTTPHKWQREGQPPAQHTHLVLLRDRSAPLSTGAKGVRAPQDLPPSLGLRFPMQDSTEVTHRWDSEVKQHSSHCNVGIVQQSVQHPSSTHSSRTPAAPQALPHVCQREQTETRGALEIHIPGLPKRPNGCTQTEQKPKAKAVVCQCPSENIGFPALLDSAQTRQAVFAQQILFVIS